ncbi:uncharacterized protein DNG_05963 [Cephalotrichum gorgonifer]|uniref:Uncharacterized protein n=1 Tax=Cephalotrichum gorgonifer TaxID=2041049 RepID=A0AAE8MYW9_9PEZI|nr:uncharacterized protein DNG_05963 [Cephalotrichum gorgonifer]
MCLAESLQYASCGCYHGCRTLFHCPRGTSHPAVCYNLETQGVAREEGFCPPCTVKNRQKESLGVLAGDDVENARRVVDRAVGGRVRVKPVAYNDLAPRHRVDRRSEDSSRDDGDLALWLRAGAFPIGNDCMTHMDTCITPPPPYQRAGGDVRTDYFEKSEERHKGSHGPGHVFADSRYPDSSTALPPPYHSTGDMSPWISVGRK